MQHLGNRANYIAIDKSADNALDFCIAYYIGLAVSKNPHDAYYIISKDTGFDPLIKHLKNNLINITRAVSISEMECFKEKSGTAIVGETKVSEPTEELEGSFDYYAKLFSENTTEKVEQHPSPITASKTKVSIPELVELAINDLVKRKSSKPRTEKTLISTIHAKCGKDISSKDIKTVYETLIRRGFVIKNGDKVSYDLPA